MAKPKVKKTLAQKREEDAIFYQTMADRALDFANNTNGELKEFYIDLYRRSMKALEVSKLDPVAAYRVYLGVYL